MSLFDGIGHVSGAEIGECLWISASDPGLEALNHEAATWAGIQRGSKRNIAEGKIIYWCALDWGDLQSP